MSTHIHRIIMSKRVAERYIDEISKTGRTLTVFFPAESSQRSFIASVKTASYGNRISVSEGFDQATFLSLDADAVSNIEKLATSKGFDWTDF